MPLTMVHRRADKTSGTPVDSKESAVGDAKKGAAVGRLTGFLGSLCFLGLFVILVSSSGTKSSPMESMMIAAAQKKSEKRQISNGPPPMSEYPDMDSAFLKYDDCVVSWKPPPPKTEWDTKPLWLPAFPASGTTSASGKGDIMKPLVNGITGLKAGGKFYHASSKVLKRCKGLDETATCAQGHPVVEIGPEKQVANFYHSIILLVRNFKTAFPAFQNDKAEAYHGAKGQIPENRWRYGRDEWYREVFNGWKKLIMTWKEMKEYDIGLYLQYEELMDPERGPAAVQRIADLLQTAGFTVAPKEDLPCIWFKTVKDEYLRLKDYRQYTPGYTKEQRDVILQELDKFQKEVADDKALSAILYEYYNDIRDNTYIDIPYQKVADAA